MLTCPTVFLHNSKTEDPGSPELIKKKKKIQNKTNKTNHLSSKKLSFKQVFSSSYDVPLAGNNQ